MDRLVNVLKRSDLELTENARAVALRYANFTSQKSDAFLDFASYHETDDAYEIAYYVWVIESTTGVTVVDSGFNPAATRPGRHVLTTITEALRGIGIEPADVKRLVLTHFHYDHIGNIDRFPNAEIIASEDELEFWNSRESLAPDYRSHIDEIALDRVMIAHAEGRVTAIRSPHVVDGSHVVIPVGGHTPGQLVVVVRTQNGDRVLTSDAVHFYDELERRRPYAAKVRRREDLDAAYDLIEELAAAPGSEVVPGHDPKVHERYPALGTDNNVAVLLG